jgi:hypothetical protein
MLAPPPSLPSPLPVLVVGGEGDFVRRKLTPQLARHGLAVDAHWEWKKKAGAFPESSRLVFVLTDMAGHYLNDAAVREAWKRGLPVIYGGRKWALNKSILERAGFLFSTSALSPTPLPRPPAPVPPPPPPVEVVLMPCPKPFEGNRPPIFLLYEQAFDSDPHITNKEAYAVASGLAKKAGLPPGQRRDDICSVIRKERGIVSVGGPRPVPPVLPVLPVPADGGRHRGDGFGGSDYTAGVSLATVAPPPAPIKGGSASPDLAAAVALLRGAMAAEGITDLSVSEKGVTFRRVVIEEGSFSL